MGATSVFIVLPVIFQYGPLIKLLKQIYGKNNFTEFQMWQIKLNVGYTVKQSTCYFNLFFLLRLLQVSMHIQTTMNGA